MCPVAEGPAGQRPVDRRSTGWREHEQAPAEVAPLVGQVRASALFEERAHLHAQRVQGVGIKPSPQGPPLAYFVARRSAASPALVAASAAMLAVGIVGTFGGASLADAWASHVVALVLLTGLAWPVARRAQFVDATSRNQGVGAGRGLRRLRK